METITADTPPPSTLPALAGYQLRLPAFEGPLDVLLRLVERQQLPITDVSLIAVTDQFLAYLGDLADVPPATIAEFAAVGARLVLLKSRSLLPRPAAADEGEPDESDLVRQLTEYQQIKHAAATLAERDRRGEGAFGRGGGVALPAPVALPPLAPHQPTSLARAIRRRLTLLTAPVQPLAQRRVITLREMVERVLERLPRPGTLAFRDVLTRDGGRQEALTAFLAVLVLVRRRVIDAEQHETFGEIRLRRSEMTGAGDASIATEFAADD